jgi:hypothetical protein
MNEFIREQFVTKEIAQQLHDMGYSEDCFGYYYSTILIISTLSNYELDKHNLGIAAPLWQQVIDWLREKHITIVELPFTNRYGVAHKFKGTEESTFLGCYTKEKAIEKALTLI